jgi:hypothetical protein
MKRLVWLVLAAVVWPADAQQICSQPQTPELSAQRPAPQLAGPATRVEPRSIQLVSSDLQPIGAPIPYTPPARLDPRAWQLAYDCFEPDEQGRPTDGRYGVNCGLGSERWWFGSQYTNCDVVDDMYLAAGTEGRLARRMEFMWAWYPDGGRRDCLIGIFTTEDYSYQ